MIWNRKKVISLALVMALSVVSSVPVFAKNSDTEQGTHSTTASEESISINPLDSGKDVLYYLFWTKDTKLEKDLVNLQKSLKLSSEQMSTLKALGLKQSQTNDELSDNASSSSIGAEKYNAFVKTEADKTNQAIQSIMKVNYQSFRNWIATWWQGERSFRKNLISQDDAKNSITPKLGITTHTIYATQYNPNTPGTTQVALPDKYLKFANLGWDYTYWAPPYTVSVRSSAGSLSDVKVNEVGPRNEDDNYWDTDRRSWNGQLSQGTPETFAAYYDNFNNGKDEFGYTVTNPAGIDLSPATARALGLGTNANGWIVVDFSGLP